VAGVPWSVGARHRVYVLAVSALVGLAIQPELRGGQQQLFVERVEVARILIDARVVDDNGRPIRGLSPADFSVTIDGRSSGVESVEWVGARGTLNPAPVNVAGPEQLSELPKRLIVFFIQKTLSASPAVNGRDLSALIRALQLTDPLLAALTSQDRVAVLSFDSHLRIWSDFSSDFSFVRNLLRARILRDHPENVAVSPGASLVSRLTEQRGRTVYTMEQALQLIGGALEPLPGPKIIILFGYGFGKPDALNRPLADAANLPGFLNHSYKDALAALLKARVSVFSLDVTDAHHHALEVGLQAVATDSGGYFTQTNLFPDQAINRVAETLAGHYVLFIEKPAGPVGSHRIVVKLKEGHKGTIHAPAMYVDPSHVARPQ
jgi:VWFA-related protein